MHMIFTHVTKYIICYKNSWSCEFWRYNLYIKTEAMPEGMDPTEEQSMRMRMIVGKCCKVDVLGMTS